MKILVLSDSHGEIINLDTSKFDYVIHCGDYGKVDVSNYLYVRGNCDFKGDKEIDIDLFDKKFYITHGDLWNVKWTYERIIYKALSLNANYCLFGHTHRQDIFKEENIIFLNPGAYLEGSYAIIYDDKIELYNNLKLDRTVKL